MPILTFDIFLNNLNFDFVMYHFSKSFIRQTMTFV